MIHSRTKAIGQIQAYVIKLIDAQPFHTLLSSKRNAKPSSERPRRAYPKRRKPIPFVSNVKEVQDPVEALSLFDEYHQMGFKHDYPSYSALLYKLARCRNFEAVEAILGHVQDRNIHCRETLFIVLIQHYAKAHSVEKAIELFHQIPSFNCVRTLQSFNAFLNVLIENDRFCEANDIFGRSYKMGFRLNTVSFNIMIKGWLEKGEWEEACKVFEEMLEKKVQPSVVTYNSLIGFLCRKGELDKAMGLLEDMRQKGKYPNAVTYALLMEGMCSVGKHSDAKKMMFDMEYRGCKPQLVNFGVLMTDLGKRGKIDEAKSLLNEMKKRRFKRDVVTYNILINYLSKEGRAAEAYKYFIEMQIGGCVPNAATYRIMVDGFCRVEDFEGALKVFNAMLISRHCPRLESFEYLVMGLMVCGKLDDACFVLDEMRKRDMQLGLEGWKNLVIKACGGGIVAGGLVTELISVH